MNLAEFKWHAIRGHGECVVELLKRETTDYSQFIQHLVLNNYAFLIDENRESYVHKLAEFYNQNEYYIDLIIKKLSKTKLENYFTFGYLINVLYFFLKNCSCTYKARLFNMLKRKLNKSTFTFNENKSVNEMVSLLLDLFYDKEEVKLIINNYYKKFKDSNLELSTIEYSYGIRFDKLINNIRTIDYSIFENYDTFLACISNEKTFEFILPIVSIYMSRNVLNMLVDDMANKRFSLSDAYKVAEILYVSKKITSSYSKKILSCIGKYDNKTDEYLFKTLSVLKSKSLKDYGYSLLSTKNKAYGVAMLINNYESSDFDILNKKIKQLKINYSNSDDWFFVEEQLIRYFNKKNIDIKMLDLIYYFLKNGLSSFSRYSLVKILIKFNYLDLDELQILSYDANYNTRKLVTSYLKKH